MTAHKNHEATNDWRHQLANVNQVWWCYTRLWRIPTSRFGPRSL